VKWIGSAALANALAVEITGAQASKRPGLLFLGRPTYIKNEVVLLRICLLASCPHCCGV
jgi:hypothetical protein